MPKKIIRQYYILSFLFSAMGVQVISAIYVSFLLKNGLNLLQVNLVNAVFFLTLFVCEIPTGAFADIFGRKKAFVAASALMSLGMFVYGSSHTFIGFVCAEAIAAVGSTFRTGAFQAWLVDSLKHRGYKESYTKIFGRETVFNQIGGGLGAIAGSYLAARNPTYPWFLGGIGMAIVAILALTTMQEEYFVKSSFSWKRGVASMKEVAVSSFHYGTKDKAVRFILLITFVQIYAVQAINMYWQPFFRNHGVGEAHLGFLFTGMMAFIALGGFLVSHLNTHSKERRIILLAMAYVGLLVAMSALAKAMPLAILFFLLHEVGRGFWNPMKDSYLQQHIPSHERATITSFCAVAPHIGGAIGLVISGFIAQMFGITVAWVVAGVVLIGGAVILRKNGTT